MLKFRQFLVEARRNPEMNPKVSAYEQLKKYKDDPNIYISYTDLKKVGIKPLSEFNTPNGIYCYPLKEMWKDIEKNKDAKNVPFAGDRPYIHVLRYNGKKKFVSDMYSEYTNKDYDSDMVNLESIYEKLMVTSDVQLEYKDALNYVKVNKLTNITPELLITYSDLTDKERNELWKRINTIHNTKYKSKSEAEAVGYSLIAIFSTDYQLNFGFGDVKIEFEVKEKGDYFELSIDATPLEICEDFANSMSDISFDSIKQRGIDETRVKNPITMFWLTTKLVAEKFYSANKSTQGWNNILRQLGYVGFADKSGRGIIHPSEPIQCVFLTKDAFKVEEMILNKSYSHTEQVKEIESKLNETLKRYSKDSNFSSINVLYAAEAQQIEIEAWYSRNWEIETVAKVPLLNFNSMSQLLNQMKIQMKYVNVDEIDMKEFAVELPLKR